MSFLGSVALEPYWSLCVRVTFKHDEEFPMRSIFRKPNLMATLIAVVLMSAVHYYHGAPNLIVSAILFGLIFFALFSVFLSWVNQTPKD